MGERRKPKAETGPQYPYRPAKDVDERLRLVMARTGLPAKLIIDACVAYFLRRQNADRRHHLQSIERAVDELGLSQPQNPDGPSDPNQKAPEDAPSIDRPITLKIPEKIHARLKLQKKLTGQSIRAAVIAALEAPPPPPPHSPDVEYWLAVKEQKRALPRSIVVDRLLVWLMRHEDQTQQEVI